MKSYWTNLEMKYYYIKCDNNERQDYSSLRYFQVFFFVISYENPLNTIYEEHWRCLLIWKSPGSWRDTKSQIGNIILENLKMQEYYETYPSANCRNNHLSDIGKLWLKWWKFKKAQGLLKLQYNRVQDNSICKQMS